MKVSAPAKINPFLAVGPRRADGFHEINSIMQAVSLADTLEISAIESGIRFDVTPPGSAPEDESNLVIRAVRALWGALGRTPAAGLRLTKAIPAGAGLGGGSADAAAALIGLNDLWSAGMSRKALEKIGASIGSDVPFCVRGGTAAARGRGEVLAPLPVRTTMWWVLVRSDVELSTAEVYARFDALTASVGADEPYELADALARGDVERAGASLRNDLAPAALAIRPELGAARDRLRAAGAAGVVLCGSGSAWAGLCRDEPHARQVASEIGDEAIAVHSLDRGPTLSR